MQPRGRSGNMASSASAARDALFGGGGGASAPRVPQSLSGGGGGGMGMGLAGALEQDNDRLTAELERKVAALRNATRGIHDEVSEQNRMLGGMQGDFERTGSLMGVALGRLDGLLRGGATQGHLCFLVAFMMGVFLLVWLLVR